MIDNYSENWVMSSELITKEAIKRGYSVNIIDKNKNFYNISDDTRSIYFKANDCGVDTSLGIKIADDKEMSYAIAEENNIPIPKTRYISRKEKDSFDISRIQELHFPVIIKPTNTAHGNGVFTNIQDITELKELTEYSFKNLDTQKIIIQEQIMGDDYRILIIGGRFIAATKRIPPYIVGNGERSIKELIDIENDSPLRGNKDHHHILNKIPINAETEKCLLDQGYQYTSILPKGRQIFVRSNNNISTGGLAIDVTDIVHEDIKSVCIKYSKIVGLGIAGVDIMTMDITRPLSESKGAIIEINNTPGIRMHHFPTEGQPKNVAGAILDFAFSNN